MRRRSFLRLSGTAIPALSLAGCSSGSGSESGPDANRVSMTDDLAFGPAEPAVDAGATVRWVNDDSVVYTVAAGGDAVRSEAASFASGGFDSEGAARENVSGGLIDGGETYEHTFAVTGRYDYCCTPHERSGMEGTVRVRDG